MGFISSSHIRNLVQSGKITSANRFLGRPYSLNGNIISGDGLGEKHLLPTLNLKPFGELIPQTGVYITKTVFERKVWPSITNVGMRPTLSGQRLRIETHILDENIVQAPKTQDILVSLVPSAWPLLEGTGEFNFF